AWPPARSRLPPHRTFDPEYSQAARRDRARAIGPERSLRGRRGAPRQLARWRRRAAARASRLAFYCLLCTLRLIVSFAHCALLSPLHIAPYCLLCTLRLI